MTEGTEEAVRDLLGRLTEEVAAGNDEAIRDLLGDLHASDIADLIEGLEGHEPRLVGLRSLPLEIASETLSEMEEGDDRAALLAGLTPEMSAELLHQMADDDAADLIAELEPGDRSRILSTLSVQEAGELQGLLVYDEETAGGLMTTAFVAVKESATAQEAIDEVRRMGREVDDFYTIFVVDPDNRLLGTVPLDDLILAEPHTAVSELVEPVVSSVTPEVDQEVVGRLLSRYNLASIPVVNEGGRLLGRITFDDVIDVMEAEQTEDILRLAGLSDEEELRGHWGHVVRIRLPWLLLNLFTVAAAASVVFLFAEAIDSLWYLAAIMPIVAGLGGNSGTQALAVTVRSLALTSGPLERKLDTVRKEALVGLVNGAAVGLLAAVIATGTSLFLGLNPVLGLVVLLALWGNILLSGFAGAFIPTLLDRIGVDPAVASSVFLTTLTDLFGFFILLGLATALLL